MNGSTVLSVRLIDCRAAARKVLMMKPTPVPNLTKNPFGAREGASSSGRGARGPALRPPSSASSSVTGQWPAAAAEPPDPAIAAEPAAVPAPTVWPSSRDTSPGPTAETKMSSVMNWASGPPGSPGNTSTVGIRLRG